MQRSDDGLLLNYAVNFELPRGAEEALNKAVPLYFVAEAEVFRDRWYWRDKRIASAARVWRIVFQPLTSNYRVTFGGLSQSYATRAEAFAAIRRGAHWKIAETGADRGRRAALRRVQLPARHLAAAAADADRHRRRSPTGRCRSSASQRFD